MATIRLGIEQRARVLNGRACAAVEEKTFTAESRIPLPAGDAVVLDISGVFLPEAATVLTGQVNCQGTLRIQAAFRPAGVEEITARQVELPVRQTLDLAAAAEQMPRLEEAYRRVVEALTQAGG